MSDEPEYITKLGSLPDHMQSGMRLWIEHGHGSYPGHFLTALLSNDLMGALGRADEENRNALHAYAVYLYCSAPPGCYGSKEKFAAWKGLNAQQAAA